MVSGYEVPGFDLCAEWQEEKDVLNQLLLRLETFNIEHALIKLFLASRKDELIEAKNIAVNAMTILNV